MNLKEYPFEKYGYSQIRVIDDTDFACEGDDPFATAQLLLTPKLDVRAITAANFVHRKDSVEKSYELINVMLDKMDLTGQVKVLRGSLPMTSETEYETSEATDFIVEEALRDDPRPLFIAVQGAITNVAIAIKTNPAIVSKIHVIWIGGATYPKGGREFNLSNDVIAARIIMDSGVSLWQVPQNVYSMMRVSFMELYENIYHCGKIGKWLCENLWEFGGRMHRGVNPFNPDAPAFPRPPRDPNAPINPDSVTGFSSGEQWSLGDNPVVGLMMNAQQYDRDIIGAPYINDDGTYTLRPDNPNKIAVYRTIDSHFILNDLFAKLRYQYGDQAQD